MHAVTPHTQTASSSMKLGLSELFTAPRRWACAVIPAVLVACGGGGGGDNPAGAATYTVGITVNAIGTGEVFKFALGTTSLTVPTAGVSTKFPMALATGAAYTVNQTDGPRTCTASPNRTGTIASASANVEVTMNCGIPPAVFGELSAPVGTVVVLQNNGGDDLSLTMPAFPGSNDHYNQMPFTFATQVLSGDAYQVTVKTPPANQTCSVFKGATGTLSLAIGALKAGCEYTYDHVSRSTDSAVRGTYFDSSAPAIGGAAVSVGSTADGYGEGRFVAFVSNAAGLGGSSGAKRQVFWRDRLSGETVLISAGITGVEGNGDSWAPAISADGLTVAFESYASNLVANDTNAVRDVFVWSANDRSAGAKRVSVGPAGVEANAESYEPTLSGDGKVVAFSSGASNLTPGVSGTSTINVYRRDLTSSANTLVSASISTGAGVGGSRPALSEDGKRLAFYSFSAAITAADGNSLWDIFVYDHTAATNTRVSLTTGSGERNQGSESASRVVAPAISGNGRYVAFATTATNMVAGDNNAAQDVFVVDTQTGAVTRASLSTAGAEGNADSPVGQGERLALSYDGAWVGFSSNASNLGAAAGNAIMHNRLTGETRALSSMTGSSTGPVVLSRSGSYAVFGAGTALDSRFSSTGLFVRFTGVGRAFLWID